MSKTNGKPDPLTLPEPHSRSKIPQPKSRPLLVVNDPNGQPVQSCEPVDYLGWHSGTGQFYRVKSSPRDYLGSDLTKAIWKFRQWEQRQTPQPMMVVGTTGRVIARVRKHWVPGLDIQGIRETFGADEAERFRPLAEPVELALDPDSFAYSLQTPDEFYGKLREWILTDPEGASKKIGIPELARLDQLPVPEPSLSLTQCLDLYKTKRKSPTEDELKKVEQQWSIFADAVDPMSTLEQISEEHIERWIDAVFLPYEDGDGSPKTVRHKIDRVARVLRYCKDKKGKDKKHCDRLLDWIKRIELPDENKENPNPIGVDEFHALLTAAKGTFWEPILLTMLNCCYYPVDIRRLPVEAVDVNRGTIVFERKKKRTPRVACLWERTKASLMEWMDKPGIVTHVFPSSQGMKYSAQGFRNAFRRFRDKAELDKSITLDRIRDGAYSAAVNDPAVNEKQAMILAGAKLSGKTDAYVKRAVNAVAPACKAIENYYFGEHESC